MTLDLAMAMLVKNPPMERLVQQIDFMSSIVSQFVIVDTGSQPEDIQKMVRMNKAPFGLPAVKILQRPWENNFADARNHALSYINRAWTLVLDPDELPSMAMMQHIRDRVTADLDTDRAGYLYWTKDYYDGMEDPYAEYQWHVRLFRSGRGRFYRALDELVELDGFPEPDTRGTNRLPKAPRDAYLIHSKSRDATLESKALYATIAKGDNT